MTRRRGDGRAFGGEIPPTRIAKHARHCLRLLHQGHELLTTGTLTVNVAPLRNELVAAGELAVHDPDAFADLFRTRAGELDQAVSVLANEPDRDTVNALIVRARRRAL